MSRGRKLHLGCLLAALAAIGTLVLAAPSRAPAENNLLLNGDLSKGSGPQPDNWRTEAWINDPKAWHYDWTHPAEGGAGQLEVENLQPDDARWMESLSLSAGWYYASAEIRTDNVGANETGATISIMDDGIMSPDIRGTTGWQTVGLYMKVGADGADVDVALRVGGFGSLNKGRAFFRNAKLVKIEGPPAGATPTYDLAAIRNESQGGPVGSPITLVAAFAVLGAVAFYGWRMYGRQEPVPAGASKRPARRRS